MKNLTTNRLIEFFFIFFLAANLSFDIVAGDAEPVKKKRRTNTHWRPHEDQMLLEKIKEFGSRKIIFTDKMVCGKSSKQCRHRYREYLDPSIVHGPMTDEEDEIISQMAAVKHNRWARIASFLPGRTPNQVKNWVNGKRRKTQQNYLRNYLEKSNDQELQQKLDKRIADIEIIIGGHLSTTPRNGLIDQMLKNKICEKKSNKCRRIHSTNASPHGRSDENESIIIKSEEKKNPALVLYNEAHVPNAIEYHASLLCNLWKPSAFKPYVRSNNTAKQDEARTEVPIDPDYTGSETLSDEDI